MCRTEAPGGKSQGQTLFSVCLELPPTITVLPFGATEKKSVYSLVNCLLSASYVLHMILGSQVTAKNETVKSPGVLELTLKWGDDPQLFSSFIHSCVHSLIPQTPTGPDMVGEGWLLWFIK